jgi:hypothetical protein
MSWKVKVWMRRWPKVVDKDVNKDVEYVMDDKDMGEVWKRR